MISEGAAFLLTSEDGKVMTQTPIHTRKSTQEETDTWVILYC